MLFLLLNIVVIVNLSEAARILAVFPAPSISHQVVFRPLTQELAKRGHEVVVITPDPAFPKGGTPLNLTEIDFHETSYTAWKEVVENASKGDNGVFAILNSLTQTIIKIMGKYFENAAIQNLITTRKFDLLLVESLAKPALIFGHIFKIPVIQISSGGAIFDNFNGVGAPTHPILYPSVLRRRSQNLNAWEKIAEAYEHFLLEKEYTKYDDINNAFLKKYLGENAPTVNEMVNNVDMLFLNMHPLYDGIRPVPSTVLYMGGLHQKPEKILPEDLKTYLDSSKQGVIYISFGTKVVPSLLPPERIQAIVKVFSDLPYNVLWKYDKDELPGKAKNIRIGRWFPQSDLLRHPNIKLFITQAGLQSTDEAITAGVPLIGIPILGDQWFNAEKYEHHKIGIKLDIETLNYDDLKKAITTITNDESYRRNIVKLRELMHDEPMKPLERAVWWTEYVLRHGGAKHLRSPAANITWAQYLELELVLTLLAGLLISAVAISTVLYCTYKKILKAFSSDKSTKKKKSSKKDR